MNNTAHDQINRHPGIDDVKLSLGRCLLSQNEDTPFFELFYNIFIDSHPDFKTLFANTDFDKQFIALKNGINMAIMYADGDQYIAKDVLEKIGKSHSKSKMNIKPEYYGFWIDSLIEAIRRKDDKFNDELEKKWKAVLLTTVDFIIERY